MGGFISHVALEKGTLAYRFDRADFENGYSRNLLWRLWEVAKLLQMSHLFELCCEVGYWGTGGDDYGTPLSSQPLFLKVWVHGKFHHRVSREGLGTLDNVNN